MGRPAIPGGLVALVGAIVASWALNLQSHGVSILGPVPSGLPSIGPPSGVTLPSAHWASSVVLPYPEGAGTQIGLVGVASSRSSSAVLGTMRWVGGGGWSLDSRSSNDPGTGLPSDPPSCPFARPRGKAPSRRSQHRREDRPGRMPPPTACLVTFTGAEGGPW